MSITFNKNGPVHRRPTFSNVHMMPKATRIISLAPYPAFATNFAMWAPHGHMKKSDMPIVTRSALTRPEVV